MLTIDRTTYPKAKLAIGTGYDRRPAGREPKSEIVHTTNGRRGSSFASEANYIFSSSAIGSHYLIGKRGQIVEFLDPRIYRAWHAGSAVPLFINSLSIGIECHLTLGEAWTAEMRDALTWLTRDYLMPLFGIPVANIDTHRAVALPRGRKIDPSEWPDAAFYRWRASLANQVYVPQVPRLATYIVTTEVNVREGPSRKKPVALKGTAVLPKGFAFQSDVVVPGEALASGNQWVHMVAPADWGFVHSSCVQAVTV